MDIDDIRRINIANLEAVAGSPTKAAEKVGMTLSQYSNLKNGAYDPRSGKQRGMRKETAWRFEDAYGLPRGWLDIQHLSENCNGGAQVNEPPINYSIGQTNVYQLPAESPLLRELNAHVEKLNDRGLILLIEQAEQLTARYSKDKANLARS